jgi:hypothetical protein
MLLAVLLNMGIFQLECSKRNALPDTQNTIVNTWTWWKEKAMLQMNFSRVSGNSST